MYTLLYLKWITNKVLLYSTWNSAQCYVAAWTYEGFKTVGSIEQVYLRNTLAVKNGAVQETQGVYLKRGVSTL